jgi:ATP-GRASP peptide maturase of grasp-with-spasm system
MILIISDVGGSVNDVIDWIISKNIVVHRFNPFYNKNIKLREMLLSNGVSDIEITYEDKTVIRLSEYDGIWIWHSNLRFSNAEIDLNEQDDDDAIKKIMHNLEQHHKTLISYLGMHLFLSGRNVIGNLGVQSLNKLEVLHRAKNIGLLIPDSFIITSKDRISELISDGDYITKPYYETIYLQYKGTAFQNYTSIVSASSLENDDNSIFPTLFQRKIEKLFELRIFFIKNQFYSMAIFSQQSKKTEVDFRNYNFENPNRSVPYALPKSIEIKLSLLFKELNLNCGSVDMIFSKNMDYVFLEINPVGQFGMVSIPCNYYLEEVLMKTLVNG